MGWGTRSLGQAVIVVAVALPVLFAMLALLVDLGFAYSTQQKVRTAADASALAAVKALGLSATDSAVVSAINSYANANGATIDWVSYPPFYIDQNGNSLGAVGTGVIPTGAAGVEVSARTSLTTFFGGFIGRSVLPISLSSRALMQVGDVVPFGVPNIGYQVGTTYWIEGKWDRRRLTGVDWESYGSDQNDTGVLSMRYPNEQTPELTLDIQNGYKGAVFINNVYPQAQQADTAVKNGIPGRLAAGRNTVILPVVVVSTQHDGNSPRKQVVGLALFSLNTPHNLDPNFTGANCDGVFVGYTATATGFSLIRPSTLQ